MAGIMRLTTQLAVISVLVENQDEALKFYTEKLGLEKRADITFGPGMRLLTVAAKGLQKPVIALARPDATLHGAERVKELMQRPDQPWIFDTDDCWKAYTALRERGVNFVSIPTKQLYGIEATFEDPYGNTFILLEAAPEVRLQLKQYSVGTAA